MVKGIKSINLALQGGGSHGALTWGILDKLLEDGRLKFDSISATSAGAMNAVVLAQGLAAGGNEKARQALTQFWHLISDMGQLLSPFKLSPFEKLFNVQLGDSFAFIYYDYLNRVLSPYQLNPLNINPLMQVIMEIVDFEKIKSTNAPRVYLSATNVKTGKIKIFTNNDINPDAVMASACLPFLFQAVQIDEEYYWDGGYMGNPALFPLIYNSNCRDILIIHINPIHRKEVPTTSTEILNRINEISFNSSLMREMRAIAFVSRLIDDGWFKDEHKNDMKRIFMHAIRADQAMESYSTASKLNSDWDFIHQLFLKGRKQAENWLAHDFKTIGKKSSIDINEYL